MFSMEEAMDGIITKVQYHSLALLLLFTLLFLGGLSVPAASPAQLQAQTNDLPRTGEMMKGVINNLPTTPLQPVRIAPQLELTAPKDHLQQDERVALQATLRAPGPGVLRVTYSFFSNGQPYGSPQTSSSIRFTPRQAGAYRLQATAFIEYQPEIEQMQVGGRQSITIQSNPVDIKVSARPQIPVQNLRIDARPQQITVGQSSTITVTLTPDDPSIGYATYRLYSNLQPFSSWQPQNQWTFNPSQSGTYSLYAEAHMQYNPDIAYMGGSRPDHIRSNNIYVTVIPPERPRQPQSLRIEVYPNPLPYGERCTITAILTPGIANGSIAYSFFIDGRIIASRVRTNQTICPLLGEGRHQASVTATVRTARTTFDLSSDPQDIYVQPGARPAGPPPPPPPPRPIIPEKPFGIALPLLVIFCAAIIYWLIKPHPSRVMARIPDGLQARIVHGKTFSQSMSGPKGNDGFRYIFIFDRGIQTIEQHHHDEE